MSPSRHRRAALARKSRRDLPRRTLGTMPAARWSRDTPRSSPPRDAAVLAEVAERGGHAMAECLARHASPTSCRSSGALPIDGQLSPTAWIARAAPKLIVVDGSRRRYFAIYAPRTSASGAPAFDTSRPPPISCPWEKSAACSRGFGSPRTNASSSRTTTCDTTTTSLAKVIAALATADVVRPQNYFQPLPWHARWDTGRMLLNRVTGGDWPGTLGVRRSGCGDEWL